jgi:hypothetical protein
MPLRAHARLAPSVREAGAGTIGPWSGARPPDEIVRARKERGRAGGGGGGLFGAVLTRRRKPRLRGAGEGGAAGCAPAGRRRPTRIMAAIVQYAKVPASGGPLCPLQTILLLETPAQRNRPHGLTRLEANYAPRAGAPLSLGSKRCRRSTSCPPTHRQPPRARPSPVRVSWRSPSLPHQHPLGANARCTHLLAVRPRPAVPDRGQPPPALLNAAAISHLALTSRRHARRAIQRPNRPPARSVSTSWALRRKKRARKRPVRMQCLALHLPWRERHRCARSPSKMRETRPHVTCAIEYSMAHTLG